MDSFLALEKTLLLLCADLAIIIGSARVFGWLFGKVGQPPVVGEILAGVILGPSLLGRLYPGAIETLLTPKTTGVLSAMAQVGLVLLMLLIGLEFPFDRLRDAARASLFVAVAGIAVPFAASYALAGYLYAISPVATPELAFRLFFATAISITAIFSFFKRAAVPPVEMISTPSATSPRAKAIRPVLSETEIRAR